MDSVGGGGGSSTQFPGSILFSGGRGGDSSRNVPRPIRWGGGGSVRIVSVNCSNIP